jgi:hypothetical protein
VGAAVAGWLYSAILPPRSGVPRPKKKKASEKGSMQKPAAPLLADGAAPSPVNGYADGHGGSDGAVKGRSAVGPGPGRAAGSGSGKRSEGGATARRRTAAHAGPQPEGTTVVGRRTLESEVGEGPEGAAAAPAAGTGMPARRKRAATATVEEEPGWTTVTSTRAGRGSRSKAA